MEEKAFLVPCFVLLFTLFFKMLGINIVTQIASQHIYKYKIQL